MLSREQRASRVQEARGAKAHGGQVTPQSGAGWAKKGDVRVPSDGGLFTVPLIEYKWTGKLQTTITATVLEKIVYEAIADGRRPVLGISLNGQSYCLIPENDYLELAQRGDGGD